MQRLSSSPGELGSAHAVVVVGSGYGGSVAASRLARAGRDVVVLERGREIRPGEFPRHAVRSAAQLQVVRAGTTFGDRHNLFWLHLGDVSVLSGCGLGGTSLVNAGVSLRPDARVLDDPSWPTGVRHDRGGLDAGFRRAEAMLEPATYPAAFPPLARWEALRRAAGPDPVRLAPVNVHFASGRNAAGVEQSACTGCGNCVTGCNDAAKNTLDMNYLPDAVAHGARLFTEVDVRHVEPAVADHDGAGETSGWIVVAEGPERGGPGRRALTVRAAVVVLAAGTLGTTAILFRSRRHGLPVSVRIGDRFTGNGDVLAFAGGLPAPVGAAGGTGPPGPVAGPTITAYVDGRGGEDPERAVIVEDAAVPVALGRALPLALAPEALPRWCRRPRRWAGPLSFATSWLTSGRRGALAHTLTMLRIGHDGAGGRIVPAGEGVTVEWPGARDDPSYARADVLLGAMAARAGGSLLDSPAWCGVGRRDLVTVHPLGGCVMADRADDGVVDHRGEVFSGTTGTRTHRGLYVWDGSSVPRSLGVNPLLTITALAERQAARLCRERGWRDGGAGA